MGEWKAMRLGNVTTKIGSGATPRGGSNAYISEGISLIRSQNILDFTFSEDGLAHITEDQGNELSNVVVQVGDVLLNITGDSVARCCRAPQHVLPARVNQHVAIIRADGKQLINGYLFYQLIYQKPELLSIAEMGATRKAITKAAIEQIEVYAPEPDEQRAIASVLSSLDAKIDLLHRQNRTLEAMAEALFRQWFVEEAEEGVAEGTLADVAVNIRDGVPVNAFNADDRYVALEHIDRRRIALQQYGSSADVASNKYRFHANDILFGKLRPYFHKVCLTSFAGICSTDILVIRPKRPELLYYCLFAFFQDEVVEYANAGSGGTRMPRTSWSDLSKYPIALPGKEKLEAFNKVVKPMMDKLQANIPQIRSLTALRDTMLPKLMSGEVRVEQD
jgi:type I restriction enzyme S subunit